MSEQGSGSRQPPRRASLRRRHIAFELDRDGLPVVVGVFDPTLLNINRPQIADGISHPVRSLSPGEDLQDGGGRAECSAMEAAGNLDAPPIGTNIVLARWLAGHMGQRKLAAQLGISQSRLSEYENGHRIPKWPQLVQIARHTGIADPGWFYLDHSDLVADMVAEKASLAS